MDPQEQNQAVTATEEQPLNEGEAEQLPYILDEEDDQPVSQLYLCLQNPRPSSSAQIEEVLEGTMAAKSWERFKMTKRLSRKLERIVPYNSGKIRGRRRNLEIVENNSDYLGASSSPVMATAKEGKFMITVPDNSGKRRGRKSKEELENKKSEIMKRAEAVRASLSPEFPTVVKLMTRSHVTRGFWLGLPAEFCKLHMPRQDDSVILEDENGKEYKTKFLVDKMGISGGWKGFAAAENLLEGDVLVFHLVRPCKFKVYIIRASDFGACPEKNRTCKKAEEKHSSVVPLDEENNVMVTNTDCRPKSYERERYRKGLRSSDVGCFLLSGGNSSDFENFNITVNGLPVEPELTKYHRSRYRDLCCTQNSCLHDHLLESINSKLAAGIILETINIADAIRSSKLCTSQENFTIWDKTLKAFELLGMDVGFLRARLSRLMRLASESTEATESKRYKEARVEREKTEEKMKSLELKLLELKQAKGKLEEEMNVLKVNNAKRQESIFLEEASAPW